MTLFQIFIGMLILGSMILRPFLYKPCAKFFPAELSAAFTSTWLMAGLIITWPLFGELLTAHWAEVTTPFVLLSIFKGIFLWLMIKFQQVVNKESTSSSVFFGFIALALGSLMNNIFFHEGLKLFQILCICGFGIIGVLFLFKGDARRLSLKGRMAFASIVAFGAFFSVTDHLAIPQIGWYPHLLVSSLFMFLACVMNGISRTDLRNIFYNREVVTAGVFYTVSEFLIIYASVNLLPVSFVAVFMRLAAPIVMVVSAFKYKEQSWKNQLAFGVVSFALALPLILL